MNLFRTPIHQSDSFTITFVIAKADDGWRFGSEIRTPHGSMAVRPHVEDEPLPSRDAATRACARLALRWLDRQTKKPVCPPAVRTVLKALSLTRDLLPS